MEKGITVGLNLHNDPLFKTSMEELKNLAEACHIDVVHQVVQNKDTPSPKYYIGKGKVEEIKQMVDIYEADVIIFDDELSPSHIKNLEKALEMRVIDRTVLILDIFARRAKTTEAKLQVELAQAQYLLPRMTGSYEALSRQRAATLARGPGEQKLELDRRVLRKKISKIKSDLKTVVKNRRNQRKNRQSHHVPIVALTGYTNAGKSTLMNALIDESSHHEKKYTFEKNMLFATLETKTKKITLSDSKNFLITDTVGFIKKLPHDLVEAFKSTLEEITEADLLLHVIDVSDPHFESQITAVNHVLKEINADNIPTIYVYNKVDLIDDLPMVNREDSIFVSAINHKNIEKLLDLINHMLEKNSKLIQLKLPYDKGDIFSYLKENKTIESSSYESDGILIKVQLNQEEIEHYHPYIYRP